LLKVRLLGAVVGLALAVGSSAQDVLDTTAVPFLKDQGQANYTKFLSLEEDRAFAIASSGAHGWSAKASSIWNAILKAVFQCNQSAKAPCYAYAVNRRVIYNQYTAFAQESVEALKTVQRPPRDSYSSESDRSSIPEQAGLRTDARGYHALTPNRVPGATTIMTGQLVERMLSGTHPILIDVLGGDGHNTLPDAHWFISAGVERGVGGNTDIENRLEPLLRAIASDKSTPLVFFCLSYECWLSYNAVLRAVHIGYTNVLWYRGGTESWKGANLPMVRAVVTGVLW